MENKIVQLTEKELHRIKRGGYWKEINGQMTYYIEEVTVTGGNILSYGSYIWSDTNNRYYKTFEALFNGAIFFWNGFVWIWNRTAAQ